MSPILPISPMSLPAGTVDNLQYEITLQQVRELSECATTRPAPRKLRCIPVITHVRLRPYIWTPPELDERTKTRMLLAELSREYRSAIVNRKS